MAELTDQSVVIVRGRVVGARAEPDPNPNLANLPTVVVALHVEEVLKGTSDPTLTFRQFTWDIRDRSGAAGYRKGQHLLLMLNPPTKYGLTSPAGLEQGRFLILRGAQGQEFAVNGLGNAGLFRDLPAAVRRKSITLSPQLAALISSPPPGPLHLDDLQELIRAIAGSNK